MTRRTPRSPSHRLVIAPWLRAPMQRFVLPNWTAITIGRWIFAWRALDAVEMAHELAHVGQWRQHGVAFIARYLMASRAAARAGGDRYRDNEYEVEAAAAGEAARQRTESTNR